VKPKLKAVNKPLHHCIVHGLDNPGSSATVSNLVVAQEASAVESSSRLDFLLLHNLGTSFVAP
jgi:hypothetical protein